MTGVCNVLCFLTRVGTAHLAPFILASSRLLLRSKFSGDVCLPLRGIGRVVCCSNPRGFDERRVGSLFSTEIPSLVRRGPVLRVLLGSPRICRLVCNLGEGTDHVILGISSPRQFCQRVLGELGRGWGRGPWVSFPFWIYLFPPIVIRQYERLTLIFEGRMTFFGFFYDFQAC